MPAPRPSPEALRAARGFAGTALIGAGAALVTTTILAATGIVPLWRPSVPPPPVLREATPAPHAAAAPAPLASRAALEERAMLAPVQPMPAEVADEMEDDAADEAPPPTPTTEARVLPPPTLTPPPSPTRLPTATTVPLPTLPPAPTRVVLPTPTPRPTPVSPLPAPGLPVHLVIPSIKVDTSVVELSMIVDDTGELVWDTVPFVAGYYGITGLAGAPANVLLSGHVTTRDRGNVFRDLHLMRPGEPIVVYTADGQFTYRVAELRLVKPWEVEVLAPTTQPRLTLVTCAGEYDFRTRNFSERLVVIADLVTR